MSKMKELKIFLAEELLGNKEFDALCREYGKCNRMPNTDAVKDFDLNAYLPFDKNAVFGVLFDDHKMIGFAVVIKQFHMHTNAVLAFLDSFFVLPEYRKDANGNFLMSWAKAQARDFEAATMLITAPAGSRLERVYTRKYKRLESWFTVEIKEK